MRRLRTLAASPVALVLAATVLGVALPSTRVAGLADWLLAALVLLVAVAIPPRRLLEARRGWRQVVAAVLLPPVVLVPVALLLATAFDEPVRLGLLGLALASSEVALVGLVALAGGGVAVAVAVTALSLALSAALAPVLAPLLDAGDVSTGELLGRFGLVVLAPLALGLVLRGVALGPAVDAPAERAGGWVLALLIYASVSGVELGADVARAGVAALAFLAVALVLARLARPLLRCPRTGGLLFPCRDFAVAAALAAALGGSDAALVPALYGAAMLVAAAVLAARARRLPACGTPGCCAGG